MWLHEQLRPTSVAYRLGFAGRIRGELDGIALQAALQRVVDRHEMLRAVFVEVDGVPRLCVRDHVVAGITLLRSPELTDAELDRVIEGWVTSPYDLVAGPLFRFAILTNGDRDRLLVVGVHHLIVDLWSMALIFEELASEYASLEDASRPRAVPPEFSPVEVIAADRPRLPGDDGQEQIDFWSQRVAGVQSALPFSADRVYQSSNHRGDVLTFTVDATRTQRLRVLASSLDSTLFATVLAVFECVLFRLSGTSDISVVTTRAHRTPRTARLVGCFTKPVVLRTRFGSSTMFSDLVRMVHDTTRSAFGRATTPLDPLIEYPRSGGHEVAFAEVGFSWQKTRRVVDGEAIIAAAMGRPGESWRFGSSVAETLALRFRPAPIPLTMLVGEISDELQVSLEYDVARFDRPTLERLARQIDRVIDEVAIDAQRPVGRLPLLAADDWLSLRREWTEISRYEANDGALHLLVEKEVHRNPDRVAVRCGDDQRTFAELNRQADHLAQLLCESGVQRGDRVGLLLERSVDLVSAVLAVMKAGAAYVPLDPELPYERVAFIVRDAGCTAVVTDRVLPSELGTSIRVDGVVPQLSDMAIVRQFYGDPSDLAYVMYTSGSTGLPKGVEVEHRNVANKVRAMARLHGIGQDDVILAQASLSFDTSVTDMFMALLTGAELVVVPRSVATDGVALRNALSRSGATFMDATPTTWRMLVESGWTGPADFIAVSGGEVLSADLAAELQRRAGSVWNTYGPTETTVTAIAHRVERNVERVALGSPVVGTRVYVLDEHLQPVPDGTIGELFIAGNGVARGYHDRPDLTIERFLDDPFHPGQRMYRTGDLGHRHTDPVTHQVRYYFHGRKDHQIKLRGHRIELGEIEAVLDSHPGVTVSVVTAFDPTPGDTRLVAYVTSPPEAAPPTTTDLRSWCRRTLPGYMVPAIVVPLDRFPLTPTGKIDRNRLPIPDATRIDRDGEGEPPRMGLETDIANIWAEVLAIPTISRHDNFFELGGHSLLAVRVFAELSRRIGVRVPLSALFQAPTVYGLTRLIERGVGERHWTSLVPVQPNGPRPPFFYVAPYLITALSFSNLGQALGDKQPLYVFQPQGMDTDHAVHETVELMAAHYIREMREVQASGPYLLGGHCSGSLVAFEMARQLQRAGEKVALLVLVDAAPPHVVPRGVNPFTYVLRRMAHYRRDHRLRPAFAWWLRVAKERTLVRILGRGEERRIARLRARHAAAHASYFGGPLAGDAIFIRSAEWDDLPENDWHLRWKDLISGDLNVETVPGTHAGLVEVANSSELAERIKWAIACCHDDRAALA
jgi:amino acid adenylation domain-containing protein